MKISEIFYSIQGEGKLVGTPSVFVRVAGCNLRCTWCDTPYASWHPEGIDLSIEQIAENISSYKARPPCHVVLTGGEPMMFNELVPLIALLKNAHHRITIETAGTLWLDALPPNSIDLASISPKLANSTPHHREGGRFAQTHERHRINFDILKTFATSTAIIDRQWKFVLSTTQDLTEMETLIEHLNAQLAAGVRIKHEDILLMPEGTDPATVTKRSLQLADLCKEKGYRLSPRLHVYLWGNTRGT